MQTSCFTRNFPWTCWGFFLAKANRLPYAILKLSLWHDTSFSFEFEFQQYICVISFSRTFVHNSILLDQPLICLLSGDSFSPMSLCQIDQYKTMRKSLTRSHFSQTRKMSHFTRKFNISVGNRIKCESFLCEEPLHTAQKNLPLFNYISGAGE